jgi:hypothetical protein
MENAHKFAEVPLTAYAKPPSGETTSELTPAAGPKGDAGTLLSTPVDRSIVKAEMSPDKVLAT